MNSITWFDHRWGWCYLASDAPISAFAVEALIERLDNGEANIEYTMKRDFDLLIVAWLQRHA